MNNNDIFTRAISLATVAHSEQVRKTTNTPYILHPIEASTIAMNLCMIDGEVDQEILAAAVLHDVIEDTYITYESLEKMFSQNVIDLIKIQSENKNKSWQERKEHTINTLKHNKDINVEILIMSDKLSNLRSIHRDYKILGEDLWSKFNEGKDKQKWYYTEIANNIKQITNTEEYLEYKILLKMVFD